MKNLILFSLTLALFSCKKKHVDPATFNDYIKRSVDITVYSSELIRYPNIHAGQNIVSSEGKIYSGELFTITYMDSLMSIPKSDGATYTGKIRIWTIHANAKNQDQLSVETDALVSRIAITVKDVKGNVMYDFLESETGSFYMSKSLP